MRATPSSTSRVLKESRYSRNSSSAPRGENLFRSIGFLAKLGGDLLGGADHRRHSDGAQADQLRSADAGTAPERKFVDARVFQNGNRDRGQERQAFEHQDDGEQIDLADFLVVVGDDQ